MRGIGSWTSRFFIYVYGLVYRLKWAMSGLVAIRSMISNQKFLENKNFWIWVLHDFRSVGEGSYTVHLTQHQKPDLQETSCSQIALRIRPCFESGTIFSCEN